MKLVKILCIIILSLVIFSCNPPEEPTLNSRWRLMKVDKLDAQTSNPIKFISFPAKPRVKDTAFFNFENEYQIWSWSDSSRIEYTIINEGLELFAYSAMPYELIGDTIHFTNSRYNFQIFENSLILNGSGDSPFGKQRFIYYFEFDE